jgi:hypothetical protein
MTAEILDFGRAWVVKWSDGSYTLEQSREDAELCVEYPSLCNSVRADAERIANLLNKDDQ